MDHREVYDSQVQNETSSDEFVLHARLPSLQEIAYNQIAIAVWYKYRSTPSQRQHYELYRNESTDKLELMDCYKLMKTLAIPRFMKDILNKYLKRVREETIRCTRYFRFGLFSTDLYTYGIPQVDWEYFVWGPDGIINYKSTAIKMLNSGVLTEVQKFAIMSNFCMENEIKIFDLNRLPMETFIPKVNGDLDPLLFYWICYLKNELHRIHPFFTRSLDRHVTPNSMYNENHWSAFEYFWNRLNAEDQISFISHRLRAFDCSHCRRRSLFYNMSHDQLTELLFRQPADVISLFIKKIEMPEWAIMAWQRCKNRISNEQFVKLLESLLDKFDKKHIHHQEDKMSVLLEIWNTADDHLKNYAARRAQLEEAAVHLILSANSLEIYTLTHFPCFWKKVAPSGFKFLLKFLSMKSANFRKNLILRGDPSFVYFFDFNVVHEIFELCLPNSQGKVEFKDKRIRYGGIIRPYFCDILYSEEDHDELNRRLLRSFQNLNIPSNDVKKLIESLIMANKWECKTYYPYNDYHIRDLTRLCKFINKIFQESVSTVLKMKQSYISSFSAHSDPYERYGSLYELSKLIEQEFVHEHLQELKHRLAKILQTIDVKEWVRFVFMYDEITDVFSWCFENEEEMFLQVKRCIPIHNITGKVFERIARECSSYCFITPPFGALQRFLEWYFSGVAEKVISFKLRLINDPETTKILEKIQEHNKFLHRKCLQWIGKPNNDLHARRKSYGIISTMMNMFQKLYQFVRR